MMIMRFSENKNALINECVFAYTQSGAGLGLVGLRERIEAVGGQLRAQERPEGGWETAAWLPREAAPVEV
jgi:signal transduction histidine kinase